MNLTSYLIEGLLPEQEKKKVVAVYGGGFKPPTSGHFEVVQQALKENPEIDKFIILIGGKPRNGITPDESILIWDIYKQYLPYKVEVKYTSVPPIKGIYTYAKEHPDEEVLFVIGAREGNEEDFKDIASRTRSLDKYPNLNLRTIVTTGGVSGTAARNASKISLDKFKNFVPSELSDEEVEQVFNIVADKIQENKPQDGKAAPYGSGYDEVEETINFISLEKILDDMFEDLGIDINFTRHFKERVIERGLTEEDIIELMKKIYDTHGDEVADLGKDENRVFTHIRRLIDIAAINKGYGEDYLKDLVLKTAYKRNSLREPEFRTNRSSPKLRVNENASYSQSIDIKKEIAKLTKHMVDKGMNIKPLPKLIFKHGDVNNAQEFLGKTAYYDPSKQHIVLYTEGRHPKDIVRSYAHEMIHHIQNLEDRLGNISGTNTMEDDHLNKLEQEANLKGTMTFRNWTDSLNEAIVGDKIKEAKEEVTDSMVVVLSRNDNQINLYNLKTNEALGNINTYGNEVNAVAAKKGYGPLMYELGMANIYPKGLQSDRRGNTEAPAEAVWKKYIEGASPNIKVEKLTPKDRDYRTTYAGDGYDSSYIPDFYNYKFYNPNTTTLKQLIQKGNTLSDELRKKIILDNDKLYNDLVNEAIVSDKIKCDNCGWDWNIVDGGNDLFICHKCGHDNEPIEEKKNKDPFGLNAYARELAMGLEENEKVMDYKIYCDMDGVIADFELGYKELTGIDLQVEKPEGKEFWDPISKAGVGFWAGLKWMPGGQQLWDYIKPFNPQLLSAPSREQSSRIGKHVWVKHKIPGTKLILRYAKQKQELATPESILIDDRQINIDQWEAAGGIGILHTSAANTISQLKKLGL